MITKLHGQDLNGAPLWEARLVRDFSHSDWVMWMSTGVHKSGLITHTWGEDHQDKGLQSVIAFWLNEEPNTDSIQPDSGLPVFVNRVVPDERSRLVVRQLKDGFPTPINGPL